VERVYPFDAFAGEIATTASPVVLDVGANNGQFAAAVFDYWPEARVHSFEPQSHLVPRIREFAATNGLQDRLTVNWCAIGASSGEADFYQNRSPISASLIREKAARRSIRRVSRVPVKTLDDYAQAQGIRLVDILKLDVEGVELDAMRGARKVLAGVRLMFLEVHPPFSTFGQAAALLHSSGLTCVSPATPPDDLAQANCVFARRP
jgi:FkbM family methyltransferase